MPRWRRALCLLPLVAACSSGDPAPLETERAPLSTYTDVRAWSQQPPGLSPVDVPLFVAVTFDDNYNAGLGDPPGAMTWATKFFETLQNPAGSGFAPTFDGTPARTSFYDNCYFLSDAGPRGASVKAREDGHEIANHTFSHNKGAAFTEAEWTKEIKDCTDALIKAPDDGGVGMNVDDIKGFRTPFLAYSSALFPVLKAQGLWYDSSIISCWGDGQDGRNCAWPHTLDQGSPDNADLVAKFKLPDVPATAGLWEMSTSALFVPPDELATQYAFEPGLRGRIPADKDPPSFYEAATGRVAPLDISLFLDMSLSAADVLAILKYTLDLRLEGNRAPLIFIAHTHVYANDYTTPSATPRERQETLEKFMQYALSKPMVRMRPVADIMNWMRDPKPLDGVVTMPVTTGGASGSAGMGSGGGPSVGGASAGGGAGGATSSAGSSTSAGVGSGGSHTNGDSGCSCRAARQRDAGASWLALAALVSVLGRRRSRP